MSLLDVFTPVQAIADAVLYEGYVLYPYRASADKNRVRWQWGVVGPVGAQDDGVGEEPSMATDLVVEGPDARIRLRLRFLQVVSRRVERLDGNGATKLASVTVDGESHVSFDDAEERSAEVEVRVAEIGPAGTVVRFGSGAHTETEALGAVDGVEHRLVRHQEAITGEIEVRAEVAGNGAHLVHVEVRNTTGWAGGDRDAANLRSLVGAHVLGAVDRGLFVSTLEPPDGHADAVARCTPHRLWPVLVGATERASLVLASPVILYDQPEIAPESGASFYDGLEIDEMLSLRVMTMTEAEKTEARETDERAAAIIDRCDQMSPAALQQLHGVLRDPHGASPPVTPTPETSDTGEVPWWDPAGGDDHVRPESDSVAIDGTTVSRGSLVRIHPSRRADAQDLFFAGQVARVTAVLSDVDGSTHVALVLVDDPAADLHDWYGRYLYFAPDELEPLEQAREESSP